MHFSSPEGIPEMLSIYFDLIYHLSEMARQISVLICLGSVLSLMRDGKSTPTKNKSGWLSATALDLGSFLLK